MKWLDASCARAVEALVDLHELCNIKLELYRAGEINKTEFMTYVDRYKQLHEALYRAGYLEENWGNEND